METPPSPKSNFSAIQPQTSQILSPAHEPTFFESDEGLWDLDWVFSVLRRKALLILQIALSTTILAAGALLFTNTTTKPKYEGIFQLQVEPATAEAKSSRSFVRGQTTERTLDDSQTTNLEQSSTLDYETQIQILKSSKLMNPIIERINRRYPKTTYESLINDLNIERIKITKDGKEQGTKLLKVEYTAADPQQILFVLEQVSQAYLSYSLKERQTNIRQGISFIDNQIPQLRQRVNTVQTQIQGLRQQSNIMDPEQQGLEFSQLLSSLKRQQFDTLEKLAEAQARYKNLTQKFRAGNSLAVLSEFPSFQKLIDRYQELESQIATVSARLSEDNPTMQELRGEQKNIRNLLNKEAQRIASSAADRVESLQSQQQAIMQAQVNLNQQFQLLPAVSAKYATLKQELKIASETLDRYLSKREVLGIDVAQQEIPWELTTHPTLTRDSQGKLVNSSEKNKRILISLAAILAVLLAVAIAFLVEIIQDIIYTPNEVKRLSKLPLLGTIPTFNNSNFSSISSKIQSFKEAFNSLYSNIGFYNAKRHIQAIAISSSGSKEGKSMIATNLARAAAIAGNKVLLVDADLRSPQLHTYLKLDNTKGLIDLIESDLALHQVIQPSFLDNNLLVLTAGEVFSNPVRLLSSPKLKSLMQKFKAEFDVVIYDTPPVNFADLSWLGSQLDGIILVAKLGKTKRTVLIQTIQGLKISQLPLLGIVANGAESTSSQNEDFSIYDYNMHHTTSSIFLPAHQSGKKFK